MTTNTATTQNTRLCPTCGTRLSETATRCQVCGTVLTPAAGAKAGAKTVQGSRMPEVTLSLPAALGLLALFVTIGAVIVYFVLNNMGNKTPAAAALATGTPTASPTATSSIAPSITPSPTLEMTDTPLPPVSYKVVAGDTCGRIAAFYHVSVLSIVEANPGVINTDCTNLVQGVAINVPQPTPTVTSAPTGTLNATQAAAAKCQTVDYTVKDGDTLMSIAANYAVTQQSIKDYNGLLNDTVYSGVTLKIPLCHRTNGPTPTPTTPPPYPAVNLLLPADGASFTVANDTVTLQWSQVGELRANEAYAVTLEDITEGQGRKLVQYVTDTKFIVPDTFRPTDTAPHIIRWSVLTVRQNGTTSDNQPVWEPAGDVSVQRDFTWSGAAVPATPTP